MRIRAHVYISGKVQGVLFRSTAKTAALKHNVTGWVRNLPDGRVEAIFEGERERVEKLVDFCRKGSKWAKVVKVEVTWQVYTAEFEKFIIL